MVYNVIGLMSGSSLDGLDIAFVELSEVRGQWGYVIHAAECLPYGAQWVQDLKTAVGLPAREYQLLHTAYGHYIGREVKEFIRRHHLEHRVHFIASHGHTTFHIPEQKMTAQLGDGAAIAAETGLPVISDLRSMDVALGGQGAPIVPIGEKLLFHGYDYWLNLGGIANLSAKTGDVYHAFDVCPANRVLDALVSALGKNYDENGALAAGGVADAKLLDALNAQEYYAQPFPKSLANDFGTGVILPLIGTYTLSVQGKLRTYVEHIAQQVAAAVKAVSGENTPEKKLLVTGGGAFNHFLIKTVKSQLEPLGITVVVPDEQTVAYKEALVMALIGALRWRQQPNALSSVTGASRDSINGALYLGEG
ncbi:anhydro-N-acetylmuramic acid kinase [Chitinophaga sp. GCM10012297]|uniref:Anhydro-N-acetylmuramic acid kinase n=1 Tax=Chitinophaga chungangae TaxID=2821488 RepID=A0ABS3YFG7_9BACT|nr:anhydro-N-acetylmuramic acid kinase [Chitinophaga chungangae]MBO9153421.1 anhydro-N-acetylmuramic acid kinase [Chitinophaga chungangae]